MQAIQSLIGEALEATLTHVEGIPTGVDINSAVENVSDWQQKIKERNTPALNKVAEELSTLKNLLSSGSLDGKAIGESLSRLGVATESSAVEVEEEFRSKLESLGKWLTKAGEMLKK